MDSEARGVKKELVDRFIIDPALLFINNSSAGGIVLFSSAMLAIIIANSPLADGYHHLWSYRFGFHIDQFEITVLEPSLLGAKTISIKTVI